MLFKAITRIELTTLTRLGYEAELKDILMMLYQEMRPQDLADANIYGDGMIHVKRVPAIPVISKATSKLVAQNSCIRSVRAELGIEAVSIDIAAQALMRVRKLTGSLLLTSNYKGVPLTVMPEDSEESILQQHPEGIAMSSPAIARRSFKIVGGAPES